MKKYYVSNICLENGDLGTISGAVVAKDVKEPWSTESKSSTDILIQPIQSKLLPQLSAAVLACWVNLASGASLGYATPALPSLQNPTSKVHITESEGSWVASLVMLGALGGGVLAGPCISLGRRRALWLAAFPLLLAWILIALAPNVWALYVAHIVLGTCLGVICDASQLYVSEIACAQCRGSLGCIPVLMFNIGILVCYTAGAWLSWEKLAIFGGALTVPSLLFPVVFPESPSFLVAKGRTKEAIEALHWLRGASYDITSEYQELLSCEKGPKLLERLKGLGERDILHPILLTSAIRALSRFCGLRAILSYTQSILVSSQSSLDAGVATVITGAVQLLATLIACFILDKLGRRKLLMASQAIMGLSLISLASYLYYNSVLVHTETVSLGWLPLTAILIYIVANSMGLGPLSGIMIGEIVPQRHRSIASSITGSISWLSAFIVTKTFLDLRDILHLYGALWLYSGVCMLGVPFVYFCLPETKGISQYGIEVLFKPQNVGDMKRGRSKSVVVVNLPDSESSESEENSEQSSEISI